MIHELKNDKLTVKISEHGAEVKSVKCGCAEYMWSGDPAWWEDTAPVLFPVCGRILDGHYTVGGKEYKMDAHGFAPKSRFAPTRVEKNALTLTLTQNEATLAEYPFDFTLTADFTLSDDTLNVCFTIKNNSDKVLPYMFGWHPGFALPEEGGDIADFRIKMPGKKTLKWHKLQHGCFANPVAVDYEIENEEYPLCEEEIYANDTMIFVGTGNTTELYSPKCDRKITLSFSENLPYYCIWKETDAKARFICLEPWSGIPNDGETPENFDTRTMSRLLPGASESYTYSVKFN